MPNFNLRRAFALAVLSAAAFVFEITLTRIFAIQQFHHFAFVVISLAILGFAASGVILSLRLFSNHLTWVCIGFSTSVTLSYLTINLLPFDSYSIAWDQTQVWILLLYFTVVAFPFLFAGWAIGAALTHAGVGAYQPYAANLFGSSIGCLLALLFLENLGGEKTVLVSAAMGLLAGLLYAVKPREVFILSVTLISLAICAIWMPPVFQLKLSPYKPLSIIQLAPDAELTQTLWSATSRIDVVETDSVHVFPGLSLNANLFPPKQTAIFVDGDGPFPITELMPEDSETQNLANHMPSTLAYTLRPNAKILILNPGGGLEPLIALASSAKEVTLTEDEPLLFQYMANQGSETIQSLLVDPRIIRSDRTSRGSLEISGSKYNVITYALVDGFRPVTSGAFSLTENYILTVESIVSAYNQLTTDGLIVITRWLGTPPAETSRTWATILSALQKLGIEDPSSQLIAYRGMRTGTMMIARSPFSKSELKTVRDFLNANAFDPIFLPDLEISELNQHNQLPTDVYHEIFQSLLNEHAKTLSNYVYDIRPPTDNHPYFFHFFRWSQTKDVIASLGLIWQPFGGSGYLVLLALLGLVSVVAIPLALSPRLLLQRSRVPVQSFGKPVAFYFACLGAGYLLVEIPLIQKLTLLLDRPSVALAAVLFSILLTSGLGSLFSNRIPLRIALTTLILYLIFLILALSPIISFALPWDKIPRFILSIFLIAPAGFLMGIPFVSGLRKLETEATTLIPWAWAINGAVSGISGVIAAIVGIEFGLNSTLLLGACIYSLALLTVLRSHLGKEPTVPRY
jgi:hypothetical protein